MDTPKKRKDIKKGSMGRMEFHEIYEKIRRAKNRSKKLYLIDTERAENGDYIILMGHHMIVCPKRSGSTKIKSPAISSGCKAKEVRNLISETAELLAHHN